MDPQPSAGFRTFGVLLRCDIQIGFITVLLVFSEHFARFTYLRLYLEQVPRLEIKELSLVLLVFGIGGLLGNFAGGFIAERSVRMSIFLSSILLSLSTFTFLPYGSLTPIVFIAVGLWGIAVGTQIWTTQSGADHAESAGALLVTTTQGAIAVGAVIGGLLVNGLGIYAVIGYCSLAALIGGITMFFGGHRPFDKAAP